MIFREIALEDMPILDEYKNICSDYIFSYLYMYKDIYKLRIAQNDSSVIIRSDMGETNFYMPLGDTGHGVKSVLKYCRENGTKPVFAKIPENCLDTFKEFELKLEEDRDSFDYIYKNSDFLEYSGKEFRRQRNNLFSYLKTFTPEFDEDIKKYVDRCKAFTIRCHNNYEIIDPTFKMLDNIERFNLKGGVVMNQDEIAAFCLYEEISEDTVLSHVELTDNSHRGVHAYLVNELAKLIGERYINKEDDMGLPGLRKFKETFNPHILLKKYKAYN